MHIKEIILQRDAPIDVELGVHHSPARTPVLIKLRARSRKNSSVDKVTCALTLSSDKMAVAAGSGKILRRIKCSHRYVVK